MRQTIVYDIRSINIVFQQSIRLHTLYFRTVRCQIHQHGTKTFYLQFKFHILLYQIIIYGLQVKIPCHLVSRFIHHTNHLIGRSKKSTPLVIVESEQQHKAYHLQQDEKKPIIVFQKEVQQISHSDAFYLSAFRAKRRICKHIHVYRFFIFLSRLNDYWIFLIIISSRMRNDLHSSMQYLYP